MAKQILTMIKDALQSLSESEDSSYTKVMLPWKQGAGFSVECERYAGAPLEYQVYYQVHGKDVDCCTLYDYPDAHEEKSLKEFVDMYR